MRDTNRPKNALLQRQQQETTRRMLFLEILEALPMHGGLVPRLCGPDRDNGISLVRILFRGLPFYRFERGIYT